MKKEKQKIHHGERRRSRLWNGGMAAAFIAAVTVFVVMLQMEKNVLADYEKGIIYTAVKEIPKGQLITTDNYREYFAEQLLDKKCIPATALTESGQVEGLVAEADIEAGVLLTTGMFEKLDEIIGTMDEPVIAGVKADDLYQVVGGTLRAGDKIHIYKVSGEDVATLIWENVYVQQVFDNVGGSISNEDISTAAQRMNLYMDASDMERFYTELAAGSLRVVKVCE